MDYFGKLQKTTRNFLFLALVGSSGLAVALEWFVSTRLGWGTTESLIFALIIAAAVSALLSIGLSKIILLPLALIRQAIMHVSPDSNNLAAPNIDEARLGRELVTNLALQVYQLASQTSGQDQKKANRRQDIIQAAAVVSHLPLALFVFNRQQLVTNASDAALSYCQLDSAELFGKPLYDNVKLEFSSEHTLEAWIKDCQTNKVTDTAYWERVRVRLNPKTGALRQCDIAAYYNRDNPSGAEFIVTMFDRTDRYGEDDQSMSFVALAVHELRTPLTVLRGYIEVFEDELADQLDDEMRDFMYKMQVSANQLNAFVNNILNVARIEENQLTLRLAESDWSAVINSALDNMDLKAQVYGKTIERQIEPNLPPVAVDRVSIAEVLNNLIDNAIKYSGESKRVIVVSGLGKNGMVETTIQDFGVGMPESVLPNLFEKFYRNHRTRSQVSGSGLGLYLSKALVNAHNGHIWAKSKEGEGSTFGFSLQPYAQLDGDLKKGDNKDIVRNAHGWIKNHSLYRR